MSKTFSSKSIDHIKSYPLVQQSTNFVLSFKVAQIFSTYAVAFTNYANANVVSKVSVVSDLLAFVDAKFDSLVLANVDVLVARAGDIYHLAESTVAEYRSKAENIVGAYVSKLDETVSTYKKKGGEIVAPYKQKGEDIVAPYKKKSDEYVQKAQSVVTSVKKRGEDTVALVLKPVNEYASSTVDKVLPKVKKDAEKTKAVAENEIAKLFEIVNDTYARLKDLITSKLSELSNAVILTYNKEFDAASEKSYYAKVASASVNTGVALLKNVNSDYIQPLKATTLTYVNEAIAAAEDKGDEAAEKSQEVSNNIAQNIPAVSASA